MKHMEYYCKYDKAVSFPAIIYRTCDNCDEALCPTCGYKVEGLVYCNECYKVETNRKHHDNI